MKNGKHPIYEELAGKAEERGVYLSGANASRLLKDHLRRVWPAVKFSVRLHSYSMGSSLNVRWAGGPTTREVDEVAQQYSFQGFDGMIDMAYSKDRWLSPAGELTFARTGGTEGSRGSEPAWAREAPCPGALLVKHGPGHVSCRRDDEEGRR